MKPRKAGKDKDRRLMGDRKNRHGREEKRGRKHKRVQKEILQLKSKNNNTNERRWTTQWKACKKWGQNASRFWRQQIRKSKLLFSPLHGVWLCHCHSTQQVNQPLLTEQPLLGYLNVILQKSVFKKNWTWPQGVWKGHRWVTPAKGRGAEGTSHSLCLSSCWSQDHRTFAWSRSSLGCCNKLTPWTTISSPGLIKYSDSEVCSLESRWH